MFPIVRPPVPDGAVAIADGRIGAVGPRADVAAACAGGERWDLGDAALRLVLIDGAVRYSRCEVPTCA